MKLRSILLSVSLSTVILGAAGCAVTRGQESVGDYVDDTAITVAVKARFVEDTAVDASSIRVETMKGTVMLSGFAKSSLERNTAEGIARGVKGVKMVKNEIAVRP